MPASSAMPCCCPTFVEDGLIELMSLLDRSGYDFVTTTPATHARVLRRKGRWAADLRDVFGWSLPFKEGLLEPAIERAARAAKVVTEAPEGLRSRLRASRVLGVLFLHSAYPTQGEDAVFLGPDSYKLADFVRRELAAGAPAERIVDLGAGAGVGGVIAGLAKPKARITLVDTNPGALELARVNARFAGVDAEIVLSDAFSAVSGAVDLVLSNPPFMADVGAKRRYRHGGELLGAQLPLSWALQAARRLELGGRLLLYSGSAIVAGRDGLRDHLYALLPADCELHYREVDPDIFGEELEEAAYAGVERIAAVEAVLKRRSG